MTRKSLIAAALSTSLFAVQANALVTTGLNMQAGTAGGVSVDTTGGAYSAWGYATDGLVTEPVFDNTQAGSAVPTFTHDGLASNNRDFGHRFTFDDGDAQASGTDVATNGAAANLPAGRTWSLLFEDVVSPTESTLTLYLGGWATGAVGVEIDATVTGGSADEAGDLQSYIINGASVDPESNIMSGVYTVTFSSATETDLLIEFLATSPTTGQRNIGISGYTLEGGGGNPAIPGDTDGDGDIDDSDLGTSFSNYTGPVGAAGGKTAAEGDTDGDGDVDDSDLGTSFSGYTGPLGPASVPEPTSLALIGLGGLALFRRRRA